MKRSISSILSAAEQGRSHLPFRRGQLDDWAAMAAKTKSLSSGLSYKKQSTLGCPIQEGAVGFCSEPGCWLSKMTLNKCTGPAGGQQLQPPTHPRYVQSWNISRDERTGQRVVLAENDTGARDGWISLGAHAG